MPHRQGTMGQKYRIIVNHWNVLPVDIVDADSLTLLKTAITVHLHDVLCNPL